MFDVQRRLASQVMKCGKYRVKFDETKLDEIKEAITKHDIRALVSQGAITRKDVHNTSKFWARKHKTQKTASKQKGQGSRKGKKTARTPAKRKWINKIRLQRSFIKNLRDLKTISTTDYHELYMKSKGGFFRSLRHLKLYVQEKGLVKK
ncbi:MAG TPA: 50S ribosomal protein L19e [Candidatus Nanoarchaeia archaeon]|nr:50S ribosomal protein L19e [Candidatus Nanoarchaeia archaeon]